MDLNVSNLSGTFNLYVLCPDMEPPQRCFTPIVIGHAAASTTLSSFLCVELVPNIDLFMYLDAITKDEQISLLNLNEPQNPNWVTQ
jgi:hypothetical protein